MKKLFGNRDIRDGEQIETKWRLNLLVAPLMQVRDSSSGTLGQREGGRGKREGGEIDNYMCSVSKPLEFQSDLLQR